MPGNFELKMEGFYSGFSALNVPNREGLYFVFAGVDYASESKGCVIKRLLYIGRAQDIQSRIGSHEKMSDFASFLQAGEKLFFAYVLVSPEELSSCERGLIKHFSHLPGSVLLNRQSVVQGVEGGEEVHYQLIGSVPRVFSESDRNFSVRL